jgi:ribosomal protein S4
VEKKMLVKKTGEILNTTNNGFKVKHMSFSFKFDLEDSVKDKIEEKLTYTHPGNSKTDREGKYYTGDNGETYHESEVIVGLDEIREYKIKNNLEI